MGGASNKQQPSEESKDEKNDFDQISIETPPKQRRVMFGSGQSSKGKGYRLGDGTGSVEEEPMDVGGDKEESEEEDMSDDEILPRPLHGLRHPPPGRPHPLARAADRGITTLCVQFLEI